MACVNHFCDGVAVGRTWARLPLCSKVSASCGCARAARTWHRTLCSPATPSSLHVPPSQLSSPCSQIRTCKTTKQGKHSNTHHRRQFYSWGCSFQRRGCDAGSNVESGRANLQLPTYLVLLINFISSPAHKTHVTRRKSTESTQQNCWDESECCYPSYHSPRRWGWELLDEDGGSGAGGGQDRGSIRRGSNARVWPPSWIRRGRIVDTWRGSRPVEIYMGLGYVTETGLLYIFQRW